MDTGYSWLKSLMKDAEIPEFEKVLSESFAKIAAEQMPNIRITRQSCGGSNCNQGCKCPVFRGSGTDTICTAETAGEWGGTYVGALVS